MPVTFNQWERGTRPVVLWRTPYQEIIERAIRSSRPASEQWFVTIAEHLNGVRLDFALGIDAPHPFHFSPVPDDAGLLYQGLCRFLYSAWPGGIDANTV